MVVTVMRTMMSFASRIFGSGTFSTRTFFEPHQQTALMTPFLPSVK
jgi:hypothetical protein